MHMMAGKETPAAHGSIEFQPSNNGNTALDIEAHSPAPPSALTPREHAYVVWVQPPGQKPKDLGQIKVGNHENGELHAETPYQRFKLFITAQQDGQAQAPTGPEVLSATVAQR